MAKAKSFRNKQQKRGIDFKKIKRKIGRKLPPPRNATNTDVKLKAIVLPEQSVVADKIGLAVNKKGLTLKELLQQTSHHNAKVRKDALMGMKDLFLKYPEELKLHRYIVIEKLRERMCDVDKTVRDNFYHIIKSVVLPGCGEDNQGPFVSLIMAYIFNAMAHLSIDVRLMAFKILDLVIQFYPPSFALYAEKIFQSYEDMLQKNHFYLQDNGKLKNVIAGLLHCLSLLPLENGKINSSRREALENQFENFSGREILQAFDSYVSMEYSEFSPIIKKIVCLVPVLVTCFVDLVASNLRKSQFDAHSFDSMLSILHSIDAAIRFFFQSTCKGKAYSQTVYGGCEAAAPDPNISPVFLKNLSLLFSTDLDRVLEVGKKKHFILNVAITEIFLHLSEWISPAECLLEKFLAFIEYALLAKVLHEYSEKPSVRDAGEKHVLTLVSFIPKLVPQVNSSWKYRLLQAFTKTFMECSIESALKLSCIVAIEKLLLSSREETISTIVNDSVLLDLQISCMRELPCLLIALDDKHHSSSQAVLHLLLRLGQCCLITSVLALEYDNMQQSLLGFFGTCDEEGNICYGPFMRLDRDSQELAICCLYYFSHLDSLLLKSLIYCCLCHDLDPFVLFSILDTVTSAYKAGHIQIGDYISFFITLIVRFKAVSGYSCSSQENGELVYNHATCKMVAASVCSSLSQIGDNSLVFLILKTFIKDHAIDDSLVKDVIIECGGWETEPVVGVDDVTGAAGKMAMAVHGDGDKVKDGKLDLKEEEEAIVVLDDDDDGDDDEEN